MPDVLPSERRYKTAFSNLPREHGFEPLRVEGELPDDLRGTCYRNGPGLVELLGREYQHWFDGDGAISAVRFTDGGALGAARLIQTAGLLEERERGKPYFGAYGTKSPGLWNPLRTWRFVTGTSKNPANTNVLFWDHRLLALCEAGRPFEVDPETLRSIGQTDLDGVVERTFSAHPHPVAETGYVYNIGSRIGRPNALDLFALRPDGTAGLLAQLPLDFNTMIHDFAATERHLVIFVAPLKLSLLPMMFGLEAFDEALKWEPRTGTEVIVVPLDTPASPKRFHVDAFWAWHVSNAFETGDGEIVVDLVRYEDFDKTNDWLARIPHGDVDFDGHGVLSRATIDPDAESLDFEPIVTEVSGEFPRIAPQVEGGRYQQLYWAEHSTPEVGRYGPPDSVCRVDLDSGDRDVFVFGDGHAPSEAVFAPRPGAKDEKDGYLITQVYDPGSHTTYWAVLDAAHVSDGPIATAHMDHHVPLSFHGQWRPAP